MIQKKILVYWLIAFFLAAFVLSNSHFKSESNDSKYYTDLVVRYQNQSWDNILAPKWGVNYWGFDPNSYMRDQLPGQLILGVSLTKIGIPAAQALHILGMAFQILSFFLLVQISIQFISYEQASVLFYGLLLTPLSFSYNIRANHELGIMFFCFFSLYAGMKLSTSRSYFLGAAISSMMLMLIKGPFCLFGLIFTAMGYLFSQKKSSFFNLLFALSLNLLFILLAAYAYEAFFFKVTGQKFFEEFYKIQIQNRAMVSTHEHSFLIQKFLNFIYYFWHYLAYSLLWSLLAVVAVITNFKKKIFASQSLNFLKSRLSFYLLSSSLVFCFMFMMSDRVAGRYVFPGYYLFSVWIIFFLLHVSSTFQRIHEKIVRRGVHIIAPLLWLMTFALHFI